MCWRERETKKFGLGQYRAPVWYGAFAAITDHFVHVSEKNTAMVAFTMSEEKGEKGIQSPMKPGKYLTKFYPDMPENERRTWAEKHIQAFSDCAVIITQDADEIEQVYRNGPHSCMADGCFESSKHPTRVYAEGDLALAYLGSLGSVTARCVVWPEKKIWVGHYSNGKVYGDHSRLEPALEKLGYRLGGREDFHGARIDAIEEGGGYVVPYLDMCHAVRYDNGYLIIDPCGDLEANNTHGLSSCGEYCNNCDSTVSGETYYVENIGSICESCREYSYSCCDGCHEIIHNDDIVHIEGGGLIVCQGCYDHSYFYCDSCHTDYHNEQHNETPDQDYQCDNCYAENYEDCDDCGDTVERGDLIECHNGGSICDGCHMTRQDEAEEELKQLIFRLSVHRDYSASLGETQ